MTKYVALLRGINSGKNPSTKMKDLQELFTDLGFRDVSTIIASGNVVFETDQEASTLKSLIESGFERKFNFKSAVILKSKREIESLIKANPFKDIKAGPGIATHVTFLSEGTKNTEIPKGKGYEVIKNTNGVIFSIVNLNETKTPALLKVLDDTFKSNLTTRTWGTVERIWQRLST